MSEEKKVLCQELKDEINETVLVFPQIFGVMMQYQGVNKDFHEYCGKTISKLSDLKVIELVPDEKDANRKAIKIKFDSIINNWEEVAALIRDIDTNVSKVAEEMRKQLEMRAGKTQSGIVLPNGNPIGISPEMLHKK